MKSGKVPFNSLIRSVLRIPFERKELNHIGRDGVKLQDEIYSSLNTLVCANEKSVSYAFYKAYNNALSTGFIPDKVQISLTLPESVKEPELKHMMEEIKRLSDKENVSIVGGHTMFSKGVVSPVFTFVFSGKSVLSIRKPEKGDKIILVKNVGEAGTEILYKSFQTDLLKKYSPTFLDGMKMEESDLSIRPGFDVLSLLQNQRFTLHDISEGGIFTALYEISEGYQCGFTVDLKKILIKQETIELSEELNINPYYLYSTGAFLVVTGDDEPVIQVLRENDILCEVIGEIEKGKRKVIKNNEEERNLERPIQDPVYLSEFFG